MNTHSQKKILLSLLFALMVGAIILLAGGLPNLRLKAGEPSHLLDWILSQLNFENLSSVPGIGANPGGLGFWNQLSETLRGSIVVIFWVTLVFSIIYAVISPEFRKELIRGFMLILTMVVLLPYIAREMNRQVNPLGQESAPGAYPAGEALLPEPPPFVQQPPAWLLGLAKGLLLFLIFAGVYWLWRYLRPKPVSQAVVVRHIKQALSDLESGMALEDVVIACYRKMCQELQKTRQVQRQRYMTPREFEDYLADAGISSVHIQQLTLLFEGARYGAKNTDAVKEDQARQNLQEILKAYGE